MEPLAVAAMARAAAAAGVKRLVLLHSIKAMGEKTEKGAPFRAGHTPPPGGMRTDMPSWPANAPRRVSPAWRTVVIRPPLVYGPGVRANFAALIRLAGSGVPLPFAAVDNRRSLIARDNLADMIALAATHPAAAGQTLLARDVDLSTPQLIAALAQAQGKRARLFPVPDAALAALRALPGIGARLSPLTLSLQVDDAATRASLGWTPPVPATDALAAAARAVANRL